mmetsp:Transcript_5566/g.5083  ORF Transcript_5566/g.5083 Transcript_5566/m.5083 type:complete len:126 (+) Transcript_5566:466-843(+)
MSYCIEKINSLDLTLWMSISGSIVIILISLLFTTATFNNDPITGLFGWMNKEEIWFNLFVIGLMSGIGTFFFYPLCIIFFSPLILGNVYLLEPVVCTMYGVLLGLDKLPGLLTYIGSLITLFGLY